MSPFRIIKRITCFFTISVIFWSISRIYFLFFSMQNIESKIRLFLSNLFQSSFSDGKFIPSQLCLFIKGLISLILSECFPISSWFHDLMLLLCYATVMLLLWKHLSSFLLMGFIVAFLFFIQSGESVYDLPCLKFISWNLQSNKWIQSKTNSLPLTDTSNPIWCVLFKKEWFKKVFYNFICFIINHDFYVITFWMNYTLFIIIFGKNTINCDY